MGPPVKCLNYHSAAFILKVQSSFRFWVLTMQLFRIWVQGMAEWNPREPIGITPENRLFD